MTFYGVIFASQQQHIGFFTLSLIKATVFTAEEANFICMVVRLTFRGCPVPQVATDELLWYFSWLALVPPRECRGRSLKLTCDFESSTIIILIWWGGTSCVCILNVGYFVNRLYTTRIKCIITLLSLHVSALLGHHQVTNVYNYDIKDIPIQRIRCYMIGVL
jgi:hypothetical protein